MIQRLIIGAVGVALVFLGVLAIGFQDNLFKHAHDPRTPFQTVAPPPAPDYAGSDAWALRPDSANPGELAVFFVHPTTFWGGSGWNAPIDDPVANTRLLDSALPNHAGPFVETGRVWAPRYRQAALYTSVTHRFDARQARALARADVERAFDAFIAALPIDAPFVVAGVEQGGQHALAVLERVAKDPVLRARLAAAYVIEQPTPLDLFETTLAPLMLCNEPTQAGCVVTYATVRAEDEREARRLAERSLAWGLDGRLEATAGRALACVNPVLGARSDDFAPARVHKGGVNAAGVEPGLAPPPIPNQTSTQCRDGLLAVDRPASRILHEPWRWGGRFMAPSVNLFYADLEEDIRRRVGLAALRRAQDGIPAPAIDEVVEIRDAPINRVPE